MYKMKNNTILGFLALLSSAMIYGLFPYFVKTLTQMYGEYFQIGLRALIAFTIISIIMFIKKEKISNIKKDVVNLGLFVITIPISSFLIIFSLLNTTPATTIFMLYAGSLLVSFVVGTFIFKESITINKMISLILVVIGLLIFAYPFDLTSSLGLILGFLGGAIEGVSNSLRKPLSTVPKNTILFFQFLTTGIFALILMFISKDDALRTFSWYGLFITIIYGFSLVGLGYFMLFGFKNFDLNIGTTIISSEMFFSMIFSLILLGIIPSQKELIGGILIFLGANIPNLVQYYLSRKISSNNQTLYSTTS